MPENPILKYANVKPAPKDNPLLKHLPTPEPPTPSPGNFGDPLAAQGPPAPAPPPHENPFIKKPGGVQAQSYADGVTKWAQQGVFFDSKDSLNSDKIDRFAGEVTGQILEEAGLISPLGVSPTLTDKLTSDLRAQVRGDLMYTWRSVEPEEMEALRKRASRRLLDRGIGVTDQQIAQRRTEILGESKAARGAGPQAALTPLEGRLLEEDPEIQRWAKTRGKLARHRSELQRPEVFNGAMRFISQTLRDGEHQRALLSDPEQAQMGLVGEFFRMPDLLNAPETELSDLDTGDFPVPVTVSTREHEVQSVLTSTLNLVGDQTSAARFVSDAVGGVLQDYRNSERFRIPVEQASQLSYFQILTQSNPELATRLADAKAATEVLDELGQGAPISKSRFAREMAAKKRNSGARIMQDLMGADIGLPLTQKARRAPLDPQQDANSFLVTGQNTLGEAKQLLSVAWRDGIDFVSKFTDPTVSLLAISAAENVRLISRAPIPLTGESDPNLVNPEDFRAILDPRHTPAVWATRLAKDAQDGKLLNSTIMGVLGNGDRVSSLGFLMSQNRLDAGENFILQRLRAGFTSQEISRQWRRFTAEVLTGSKGQAMLDTLRDAGLNDLKPFSFLDPDLGSQESRDKALADLALEERKWVNHGLIPHDAGWTDFLSRPIGAASRWALNTVVGFARDTFEQAVEDPGDLTAQTAVLWGAGEVVGRTVIAPAMRETLQQLQRVGHATQRMARVWKVQDDLGAGLVMNRPATERALAHVRQMRGEGVSAMDARLQVLEDSLDTLLTHQRADVDLQLHRQRADEVPREVHKAARTIRAEVRKLPEQETIDIASGAGMAARVLNDRARERHGLIPLFGQSLRRLTRMYGKENPQWTAVHADRIWTDLKNAIESGNIRGLELENFTGHLSARESWRLGHDGSVEKIRGVVRRAFGDRTPPPEVNRYVNDLIQLFADGKAKFDIHRSFITQKREMADAFLDHTQRSWRRRTDRDTRSLEAMAADGQEPDGFIAERAQRGAANLKRLSRLRDQTRNIHFSKAVSYDRHPLLEEVSVDDIRSFGAATDSPDSSFFERMSKPGEELEDFVERINNLEGEDAAAFKQKFAREYLNSPDINSPLVVDDITGRPLSAAQRARLRKERTASRADVARVMRLAAKKQPGQNVDRRLAAAEARLEEGLKKRPGTEEYLKYLADHPEADVRGWHVQRVGDDWQKIEGWAAGEASEDITEIFSRYQDMTDGNPDSAMRSLRDLHFQGKVHSAAMRRRTRILLEDYNTWDKPLQRAFDRAVRLQAKEGDYLPMAELRRKHPDAFKRVPLDRDEILDDMLTDMTGLRHNLVEEAIRLKMIPEKDRDLWMAPYSGRVSRHHAIRSHIATDEPSTKGPDGLTGEEFSAKRHKSRYRLLVQRRNGVQEEYLFKDAKRARKFLKREFGTKKERRDGADLAGTVATGDSFRLLSPHTKQSLKLHDFAEGGAGVFNGMMNLAERMAVGRTALSMDRPGLAWTDAQFRSLDPKLRTQYTKVGSQEHGLAPLKGKWVHRDAVAMLDDAAGGARLIREWGDEVSHAMNNHRRMFESFAGKAGQTFMTAAFQMPVSALMTNLVFRNPATWYANLLSNFAIFGPAAMRGNPFDYFFGTPAKRAHKLATEIVYSDPKRLRELARSDPMIAELLDSNVLDDTLAQGFLDTEGKRAMREALFGDDPVGDRFARFKRRGMKQFTTRAGFRELLDDIGGQSEALAGRTKRLETLEGMEANKWRGLGPDDQEAAALELASLRNFMRQQTGMLAPFRRAIDGAAWLTLGRSAGGKLGRFNDTDLLSANIYGSFDNYARVRAYLINRFKGGAHDESLWHVNTFMQTYSQVPKNFRKLGRSPFGSPIMAFPFEMLRIKANLMAHKPGFYLGQSHFLPVANAVSIAASGADPDEVAAEMRGRTGLKSYGAVTTGGLYMNGMYFGTEWADMGQTSNRLYGVMSNLEVDDVPYGIGEGIKTAAPFVLGNPGVQSMVATATGRDMRNGRPMGGGIWEAAQQNAYRMGELFMPTLMPGAGKLANEISDRTEAGADITGNGRSILNSFVRALSGTRVVGSTIERPLEELRGSFREGADGQVAGKVMSAVDRFGLLFAFEKTNQKLATEFAVGPDDALRAAIFGAREATTNVAGVWETFIDDDQRELESLVARRDKGEKGLEADIQRAQTTISEKMAVHSWMTGEKDIPASPFAVATRLKKAYDPMTLERVIKNSPLPARTFIYLRAAQHSQALMDRVTPWIVGDLQRRLARTDIRAVDESLRRLQQEVPLMGLDRTRVDMLNHYQSVLTRFIPGMKGRDRNQRRQDEAAKRSLRAALEVE